MGAAESDPLDVGAPRRIDGDGTIALINAAAKAGVEQFVLVTSLGTGKLGFPAGVLNLFWGVLLFKREAEKALEASGMSYCIVRPGGGSGCLCTARTYLAVMSTVSLVCQWHVLLHAQVSSGCRAGRQLNGQPAAAAAAGRALGP